MKPITPQNIADTFNCPLPLAQLLNDIIAGVHDDNLTEFDSVRALYNHSDKPYERMLAINEILKKFDCAVFGIEGSGTDSWGNYSYINTGDPYDSTLCYNERTNEFLIESWGTLEEEAESEALQNIEFMEMSEADIRGYGKESVWYDEQNETFLEPGFYYWFCFPGCLPESGPHGPFTSEDEARNDIKSNQD